MRGFLLHSVPITATRTVTQEPCFHQFPVRSPIGVANRAKTPTKPPPSNSRTPRCRTAAGEPRRQTSAARLQIKSSQSSMCFWAKHGRERNFFTGFLHLSIPPPLPFQSADVKSEQNWRSEALPRQQTAGTEIAVTG